MKHDILFDAAAKYAIEKREISTWDIKRTFNIDFCRAGRIMLELEDAGIIGHQQGVDPQKVFFDNVKSLEKYLEDGIYPAEVKARQKKVEERQRIVFLQEQELREKEEIAYRIKEKYRRQQLEKIVRQELIDSGELFEDQPKRPSIPRELVDAVYTRDGGRCVYCGATSNLQLDHIIPFSKGGATTLENLQLLCQKCNIEKSNKIG